MDWKDNIAEEILDKLRANLEKAAVYAKEKVKGALNTSQPYHIYHGQQGEWYVGEDPSQPGQPPKKIRGDLQRSIAHEVVDTEARVGTNLEYAKYLEFGTSKMAARPFLRKVFTEEKATIARILESK